MGNDSSKAVERWQRSSGATAAKQWSDGSEAIEGGAIALLHKGVKGDRVPPLANLGRRCTGVR